MLAAWVASGADNPGRSGAVVALLWIKIIAFTLFHAFAILHGKLFRLGKATLNEVRKQIYHSLFCGLPIQFFSG